MAITKTIEGKIVADNFDRADNTNLGGNWVEVAGNWAIVSNKLKMQGNGSYYLNNTTESMGEMFVQTVLRGYAAFPGILARYTPTGSNFYLMQLDLTSWYIRLQKVVNGTWTTLSSVSKTLLSDTDYPSQLYVKDSLQQGWVDGTSISGTDTAHNGQDSRTAGLRVQGFDASQYGLLNDFIWCRSKNIIVTGMETGCKAKVLNSGGSTIAWATESGGTATIDCSRRGGATALVPIAGWAKLIVTDAADNLLLTYDAEGVYPGSTYELGGPPVAPSISATDGEVGQVSVTLTSGGEGADTIALYGADSAGDLPEGEAGAGADLLDADWDGTAFVEGSLGNGVTRYYRAYAENGYGVSSSLVVDGTTLDVPTAPVLTRLTEPYSHTISKASGGVGADTIALYRATSAADLPAGGAGAGATLINANWNGAAVEYIQPNVSITTYFRAYATNGAGTTPSDITSAAPNGYAKYTMWSEYPTGDPPSGWTGSVQAIIQEGAFPSGKQLYNPTEDQAVKLWESAIITSPDKGTLGLVVINGVGTVGVTCRNGHYSAVRIYDAVEAHFRLLRDNTVIAEVDIATPATPFWVRLAPAGNTIRGKTWAKGTAEPAEWTLSVVDTNYPNVGEVGVKLWRSGAAGGYYTSLWYFGVDAVVSAPLAPVIAAVGGLGQITVTQTSGGEGAVTVALYGADSGADLPPGAPGAGADLLDASWDGSAVVESGLDWAATRYYRAYATNEVGTTESNLASATTDPVGVPVIAATADGVDQATVTFTVPGGGAESHKLYYGTDQFNLVLYSDALSASPDPVVITGLKEDTKYFFQAVAVGNGGEASSALVNCTTLLSVLRVAYLTDVTAGLVMAYDASAVQVQFQTTTDADTGFLTPLDDAVELLEEGNNPFGHEVSGLTAVTTYRARARTRDDPEGAWSAWTPVIRFTTLATASTDVWMGGFTAPQQMDVVKDTITLSWNLVSRAGGAQDWNAYELAVSDDGETFEVIADEAALPDGTTGSFAVDMTQYADGFVVFRLIGRKTASGARGTALLTVFNNSARTLKRYTNGFSPECFEARRVEGVGDYWLYPDNGSHVPSRGGIVYNGGDQILYLPCFQDPFDPESDGGEDGEGDGRGTDALPGGGDDGGGGWGDTDPPGEGARAGMIVTGVNAYGTVMAIAPGGTFYWWLNNQITTSGISIYFKNQAGATVFLAQAMYGQVWPVFPCDNVNNLRGWGHARMEGGDARDAVAFRAAGTYLGSECSAAGGAIGVSFSASKSGTWEGLDVWDYTLVGAGESVGRSSGQFLIAPGTFDCAGLRVGIKLHRDAEFIAHGYVVGGGGGSVMYGDPCETVPPEPPPPEPPPPEPPPPEPPPPPGPTSDCEDLTVTPPEGVGFATADLEIRDATTLEVLLSENATASDDMPWAFDNVNLPYDTTLEARMRVTNGLGVTSGWSTWASFSIPTPIVSGSLQIYAPSELRQGVNTIRWTPAQGVGTPLYRVLYDLGDGLGYRVLLNWTPAVYSADLTVNWEDSTARAKFLNPRKALVAAGSNLYETDATYRDGTVPVIPLVRPVEIAAAGAGGEAEYRVLYLTVRATLPTTLRVTPILDGRRLQYYDVVVPAAAYPLEKTFEIPLHEENANHTYGVRGTYFTVEIKPVAALDQQQVLIKVEATLECGVDQDTEDYDRAVDGILELLGIEVERDILRETLPHARYSAELYAESTLLSLKRKPFVAAGSLVYQEDGGNDDPVGRVIVGSRNIMPEGEGGECAFHALYLAVSHSNTVDVPLEVVRYVDDKELGTAIPVTLRGVATPTYDVLEIPLVINNGSVTYTPRGAAFRFVLRTTQALPAAGRIIPEGVELEITRVRETQKGYDQ